MLKGLSLKKLGLTVITVSLLLAFSGCTKYASDEDLTALERQKQAALSAEKKVEDLKREKADLEKQIAAKERELSEAKRVLDAVK